MKMSFNWLSESVDVAEFKQNPGALAEILTQAGLEVEEIQDRARDYNNVVVGLILKKDKHPNSDRLSLCQVATGENVVHQIVCGATNHKENDKVIVALPGAVLPGNFSIQVSQVRGIESAGMLCSLKELALAETSDGIEILPNSAIVGQTFAQMSGLDDVIFELKVTPNRADCLSHWGLARELSCLLGRPLKAGKIDFKTENLESSSRVQVQLLSPEDCPRYTGRSITNVKVGPSPAWLVSRLKSLGLVSINNVVDVTNYVMMQLGQPMHAFDLQKISGQQLKIGLSQKGESFKTLGGVALTLSGEELVIRDEQKVLALAGVVGGENSGIEDTTQNIFLESAFFKPASVRRSSRRFGINTDSGYRFSRGVDPEMCLQALDLATQMILQLAGGVADSFKTDLYPVKETRAVIPLNSRSVSQFLGFEMSREEILKWLERLGCQVQGDLDLQVIPPSFRFDLEQTMDLVEEMARLKGYANIPETFPALRQAPALMAKPWLLQLRLVEVLRAAGFSQAMNFAFSSEKNENQFLGPASRLAAMGLAISEQGIAILNPLSEDMNRLRRTLSFSLWQNLLHNYRQGADAGALFEIGPCFALTENPEKNPEKYFEETRVAGIVWGQAISVWEKFAPESTLFFAKECLSRLFQEFPLVDFRIDGISDKSHIPFFLHRGRAGVIRGQGNSCGFIGELHPGLLESEKIRVPVAVFEMNLKSLIELQDTPLAFKPFSRFPKVIRDLALVMPVNLPVAEVMALMRSAGSELLLDVQVFDVYQGAELGAGFRSVAYRLSFQDTKASLNDAKLQELMTQVLDSVKQKWGLAPR